jgi:hypothetical protein
VAIERVALAVSHVDEPKGHRLEAADEATLDRWTERTLTASSFDGLFEPR